MKVFDKKNEVKSFRIVSAVGAIILLGAIIVSSVAGNSTISAAEMERSVPISRELLDFTIESAQETRVAVSKPIVIEVDDDETEVEEEVKPLVFDASDVRVPSNVTEEQLTLFMERYCPEWLGLEEQILEYDSRINLIFLLAVARAETWAGSKAIGDYNCFNVVDFYTGDYVDYDSHLESIDCFVRLIEAQYLSEDGMWWEGGYSIAHINIHYAEESWCGFITELGEEILWLMEERVPVWKAEMEELDTEE